MIHVGKTSVSWNSSKLKTSAFRKTLLKKIDTDCEKIIVKHISDERLL